MTLRVTVHEATSNGSGPINDLVLIHGWGMHCGVFGPCIDRWQEQFRVLTVDLPGHGLNHQHPMPGDMSRLTQQINQALDQVGSAQGAATWLGWSLGGQVAMSIGLTNPQRVARLVLVSSTPRFVTAADWPHGMADETFASFASELESDHHATWKRFLMLEAHGTQTARQDLRKLQSVAAEYPAPSQATLTAGLDLLRSTDLRNDASAVTQPTLVLSGQRDRLVPPSAAQWLVDEIAQAQLEMMPGCGHAPFIGEPQKFVQHVTSFAVHESASQPVAEHV